ncbi:syntaxin-1A-like isoform X2 [Symsagittifera roscoffensis]|uniref:syntaxin-1A-like isoform X2 n=1 Tax=Symsagittifera roscoffensis TaxID=84072 RepID=UPI00307CAE88
MKDRLAELKGAGGHDDHSDDEFEEGGRRDQDEYDKYGAGKHKQDRKKSKKGAGGGAQGKNKKGDGGGGDEGQAEEGQFMKEFFAEIERLKASIGVIEENAGKLGAVHQRMLAEEKPADKDKNEVENLNAEIRTEASNVRSSLKKMETETEKMEEASNHQLTVEIRLRKIQQATWSRKFIDLMTEYNRIQNEYRDGCKERIRRQMEAMGKPHDNNELEQMIHSENPDVFNQEVMVDDKEQQKKLSEVEMRHREILKLERSLKELHELFMDLARLVENQGETIDRIDNNVQESCRVITAAKVETKKAVKYKKAAKKKKIIIACVVVGVILIIVLIIVLNVT